VGTVWGKQRGEEATASGPEGARITDPLGDARCANPAVACPDVTAAKATYNGSELLLRVEFAPGTIDPDDYRMVVNIDNDQDSATGMGDFACGMNFVGKDLDLRSHTAPISGGFWSRGIVNVVRVGAGVI